MKDVAALLADVKLRFTIEHPSFEECYAYGYECAAAELSEADNPFSPESRESEHWLEGWWAGFYGEQPLFELGDLDSSQDELHQLEAANDGFYQDSVICFFVKVMEITGIIAVSAAVGLQVLDLVA